MGKAKEMILTIDGEYILVSPARRDQFRESANNFCKLGCGSGSYELRSEIVRMLSILPITYPEELRDFSQRKSHLLEIYDFCSFVLSNIARISIFPLSSTFNLLASWSVRRSLIRVSLIERKLNQRKSGGITRHAISLADDLTIIDSHLVATD